MITHFYDAYALLCIISDIYSSSKSHIRGHNQFSFVKGLWLQIEACLDIAHLRQANWYLNTTLIHRRGKLDIILTLSLENVIKILIYIYPDWDRK